MVDAAVAAETAATFLKNVLRSTGFTYTSGDEMQQQVFVHRNEPQG